MADPARKMEASAPQEAPKQETPGPKGQWSPEGLSLGEMEKQGAEKGREMLAGKKLELDKQVDAESSSFKEKTASWWQKTKSAFSKAKSWVRNEEEIRKLDEHVASLKAGYQKKAEAAVAPEPLPDNVIDLQAERAKRQAPAEAKFPVDMPADGGEQVQEAIDAGAAETDAEIEAAGGLEAWKTKQLQQKEAALSAEYERLADVVAGEGAGESEEWKKALKSGGTYVPETSPAGKKLNETYAELLRVRAELKNPKSAAEATEAAAPERPAPAEAEPGPGDVRYEAQKLAGEAQAFAQTIDPELRVEATTADVQPEGADKPRSMRVLRVSHQKYPEVTWVVPLGGRTPKDVLDQTEASLSKVYAQKMRKVAERLQTGKAEPQAAAEEEEPFNAEELAVLKAGGEKLAQEARIARMGDRVDAAMSAEDEAEAMKAVDSLSAEDAKVIVSEDAAGPSETPAEKKQAASTTKNSEMSSTASGVIGGKTPRDFYPDLPVPVPGSLPPGVPDGSRPNPEPGKPTDAPLVTETPVTEAPPAETPKEPETPKPTEAPTPSTETAATPAERPARAKKERAPKKNVNSNDEIPLDKLKEHMAWSKKRLADPKRFNAQEAEFEKQRIAQMEESVSRREKAEPKPAPEPEAAAPEPQAEAAPAAPEPEEPAAQETPADDQLETLEFYAPHAGAIAEAFLKDSKIDRAAVKTTLRKAKGINALDLGKLLGGTGAFDADGKESAASGIAKELLEKPELLKAVKAAFLKEVEAKLQKP